MEKVPNIGTPTGQNTTQQYSKPNQSPPHKGGGHLGPLVGRPTLGAAPPRTAIAPDLSLAVAWKHATSVPRVPHAKNREELRLSPCINREPSPSTQHTQPHQALPHSLFPSCSFTLLSCFRARQSYLGELGSLEEDILGYE
jgi:hypothetical protein